MLERDRREVLGAINRGLRTATIRRRQLCKKLGAESYPNALLGLSSSELNGDFVVLDNETQQAHSLSGAAAEVWRAAGDGVGLICPMMRWIRSSPS